MPGTVYMEAVKVGLEAQRLSVDPLPLMNEDQASCTETTPISALPASPHGAALAQAARVPEGCACLESCACLPVCMSRNVSGTE